MMHDGARAIGGNLPGELQQKIIKLLDEFMEIVNDISEKRRIRQAVIRSRLTCSLAAILDKKNVFIIAQRHFGMPSSLFSINLKEILLQTRYWKLQDGI
jgi:hypothetical protein